MERDYTQFGIDPEIAPESLAKIKNTIDAIIDGGYGVTLTLALDNRMHLAYCICKDMETMYFRGFADGMAHASKEWKDMIDRHSQPGRAGRITEKS